MKRISSVLLTVILVALFGIFAVASGESEPKVRDFSVTINSCRKMTDWQDKQYVIVNYTFANENSNTMANFRQTYDTAVYQNGILLDEVSMYSSIYYNEDSFQSDSQNKEIKKGGFIDVEIAYELYDATTDIEVEVVRDSLFDDTKLTKILSLPQE